LFCEFACEQECCGCVDEPIEAVVAVDFGVRVKDVEGQLQHVVAAGGAVHAEDGIGEHACDFGSDGVVAAGLLQFGLLLFGQQFHQ
jgi:hypothetical protein